MRHFILVSCYVRDVFSLPCRFTSPHSRARFSFPDWLERQATLARFWNENFTYIPFLYFSQSMCKPRQIPVICIQFLAFARFAKDGVFNSCMISINQ